MEITVTGLNHKRAPVELRERLAVADAALPGALAALQNSLRASEMVILSTCNRVELYAVHEGDAPAPETVAATLSARNGVPAAELAPALYHHRGPDAVRHLFEVASSLDSMVLGETQIIGQVRDAYFAAKEAGATGRVFNRLFQQALHVAKRIHATTSLGEKNVSVPSVASRLAEKIFQDLSTKTLVILGAGEIGELTVSAFRNRGVTRLHVLNRTPENARALAARCGGEAHGLDAIPRVLPLGDVVIACVAADGPILTAAEVGAALRTRLQEPMFFIDLSVPRNIHPEVDALENVYLFNIDDLEQIVQQNAVEREREVARCIPLVEEETLTFLREVTPPDVVRFIAAFREKLEAIGAEEARRTLDRIGLTDAQRSEVDEMTRRLLNKILHNPTEALRSGLLDGSHLAAIELLRKLFGINK
jgi:glutamyl-tRNA reductase